MSLGIFDVADIEATRVTLAAHDGSYSSQISSSGDHAKISRVESDRVDDFVGGDVQLDTVVDLDDWIGVTDRPSVVRDEERHIFGAGLHSLDLAEFVLGFFSGDSVDGEPSLDVVDQTEELSGLFDADNI